VSFPSRASAGGDHVLHHVGGSRRSSWSRARRNVDVVAGRTRSAGRYRAGSVRTAASTRLATFSSVSRSLPKTFTRRRAVLWTACSMRALSHRPRVRQTRELQRRVHLATCLFVAYAGPPGVAGFRLITVFRSFPAEPGSVAVVRRRLALYDSTSGKSRMIRFGLQGACGLVNDMPGRRRACRTACLRSASA